MGGVMSHMLHPAVAIGVVLAGVVAAASLLLFPFDRSVASVSGTDRVEYSCDSPLTVVRQSDLPNPGEVGFGGPAINRRQVCLAPASRRVLLAAGAMGAALVAALGMTLVPRRRAGDVHNRPRAVTSAQLPMQRA